MTLKSRLDRLTKQLAFGDADVFDGVDGKEFARAAWGDPLGPASPRTQRMIAYFSILAIQHVLAQPALLRHDLDGTQSMDAFRREQGWPIAVTPERRREWEARIAKAEQLAAETRQDCDIADDASDEEIKERLLELGIESGLTEKEMASLRQSIG
jgi:hypothetical protein